MIKGGRLVVFEGIDGVGKTTQLKLAEDRLTQQGYSVYATRNLGGSLIGEELRQIMLKPVERPPLSDLYISMAIQAALTEVIDGKRAENNIILLDRGPITMAAYHAYGGGLDKDMCWQYADIGMEALKPELVLYFTADLDTAIKRARLVSGKADYFESKPRTFFENVLSGYEEGRERYGMVEVDANKTIESVNSFVMAEITSILSKN